MENRGRTAPQAQRAVAQAGCYGIVASRGTPVGVKRFDWTSPLVLSRASLTLEAWFRLVWSPRDRSVRKRVLAEDCPRRGPFQDRARCGRAWRLPQLNRGWRVLLDLLQPHSSCSHPCAVMASRGSLQTPMPWALASLRVCTSRLLAGCSRSGDGGHARRGARWSYSHHPDLGSSSRLPCLSCGTQGDPVDSGS